MELPNDLALPLFAYGALKRGELSFFRIKPYVKQAKQCVAGGSMFLRDGLLIASKTGTSEINGDLLRFDTQRVQEAYQAICDLEPSEQYRWGTVIVDDTSANILWGRSPCKGSVALDFAWSSWNDPLFTTALDVVQEQVDTHKAWEETFKNTFHVQMAYLLLWTSIERYASLRYHLRHDATNKVKKVATEPAFSTKLLELVTVKRSVQRADEPTRKIELDPNHPCEAMKYYYQVRSNMVHRGKGMPRDHDIVLFSCNELLQIFRHTLGVAKTEACA